jgi:hypothetical protein
MRVKNVAFQGELMVLRVAAVPEGARQVEPQDGRYLVAHSETGHHHTISADGCVMHEASPLLCYLMLDRGLSIVHERSWNTHEQLDLGGGIWEVHRQREWTPDGERLAAD